MSGPTKGKADHFVLGDWNAVCMQCGFKFKASELIRHWQGYYVCRTCWEPRHPQDFVKGVPDNISPPWAQPRPTWSFAMTPQEVGDDTTTLTPTGSIVTIQENTFICTLVIPFNNIVINNYGIIGRVTNAGGYTYTLNNMSGGMLMSNPEVAFLTPASTTVEAGATVTYTVTLSVARCYASTITLSSSDETKATVPTSVEVAANALSATFDATTLASGTTTITATLNGSVTAELVVDIVGQISTLTPDPASVSVAGVVSITATLAAAPLLDKTVTLSSGTPAKVTVPASVTILGGTDNRSFNATGVAPGESIITATLNGTATTTAVTYASIASLTPTQSMPVGEQLTMTVTLDGAVTGDTAVTLSSSDETKVTVPASVTVTTGNSSATFTAMTLATGLSVITGTLNGTATATVTVAAYSSTATVKFHGTSMRLIATGERFPCGYDDLVMVSWNSAAGGSFYRIAQDSGTYTTHTLPAAATPVGLDESGNLYSMAGVGVTLNMTQPNGVNLYFDGLTGSSYGWPLQTTRDVSSADIEGFDSNVSIHWTLIDYILHTATRNNLGTAAGTPTEAFKQYQNVSGNKMFTYTSGGTHAISYVSQLDNNVIGLVAVGDAVGLDATTLIADGSANLYGLINNVGVSVVKKWSDTGTLLGSVTLTDAGGVQTYLTCATDSGYVWVMRPIAAAGTTWWKIKTSDMSIVATGTLDLYLGQPWRGAIGTRFLDQTSPVLYQDTGTEVYLGKMVVA